MLDSIAALALSAGLAPAVDSFEHRVIGGGAPIADAAVTLWAAIAGEPRRLAETHSRADVSFEITVPD